MGTVKVSGFGPDDDGFYADGRRFPRATVKVAQDELPEEASALTTEILPEHVKAALDIMPDQAEAVITEAPNAEDATRAFVTGSMTGVSFPADLYASVLPLLMNQEAFRTYLADNDAYVQMIQQGVLDGNANAVQLSTAIQQNAAAARGSMG
jgi:hypothetical protein